MPLGERGGSFRVVQYASLGLCHTLSRTLANCHTLSRYFSLGIDDLDLVEGIAETVWGSVQLQLARWLESVWGLGGPFLMLLWLRGSRGMVVVVVLLWGWGNRSRGSGLMVVVVNRGWSRSRSWGLAGVLLTERWIVPAGIVLSIVITVVVVATTTAAE